MIRRIYIKFIHFIDVFFNALLNLLERKGLVNPIAYNIVDNKSDKMQVVHPYPLNFNEKNKLLFNEWKSYEMFENKIFSLTHVSVSGNGVVFKGFSNFLPALPHPIFKAAFGLRFIVGQNLFKKRRKLDANQTYLLIFDFWSCANYYHWMVDSMCRLIAWKDLLKSYTLLIPETSPKYITDTIGLFEFNRIEYISKSEFVDVNLLHIPNYSAWSGQQNPLILKEVKSIILTHFTKHNNFEKVYVSRSKQKHRKIANENDVISILKRYHFEIVYFEGMSVSDQISIVRRAKFFVTSHGANMTNALFGENITVLELIRSVKPNFCYWSALSAINTPYYYQLCQVVNHDDLFVDLKLFEQNLKLLV